MMAVWHVRVLQSAFISCPLVLLIAACTPPGVSSAPVDAALGAAPHPVVNGRVYAFGQVLAREQQRNTALQEQLEQRDQQLEQLRTEVQQLRERENALQTALERATAGSGAAPAPALTSAATGVSDGAAAGGAAAAQAGAEEPSTAASDDARPDQAARAAEIASLRVALSQEQQHRQEAETQLMRLKEETSTPPYEQSGPTAADLATARQESAELRAALADERAARERLAEDFSALQQRAARDAERAPDTPPETADLRERLALLQSEQQAAVDSFNRSLGASQARVADLEQQLAAARATASTDAVAASDGSADGDGASIRAQNAALRTRLDLEHRRTEELSNKLKLASRVTDLIFKMQAQRTVQTTQAWVPQIPIHTDPWQDR